MDELSAIDIPEATMQELAGYMDDIVAKAREATAAVFDSCAETLAPVAAAQMRALAVKLRQPVDVQDASRHAALLSGRA